MLSALTSRLGLSQTCGDTGFGASVHPAIADNATATAVHPIHIFSSRWLALAGPVVGR
jgi:hypothetical protein